MTKFPDLFASLARPFAAHEVKVRPAQGGRQLHYVTARTDMNRLDEILGPENWWDEYIPSENSVLCKLTLRLPDGSTVTKADAGGYAGMADQGDDDKSGFSDAFKRACAKFGIGRYLYCDGVPQFVREREHGFDDREPAGNQNYGPGRHGEVENSSPPPEPRGRGDNQRSAPRTGKALFAWTKDQETRGQGGLLNHLNGWAKSQGDYPHKMIDWDDDQVAMAYAEACRRINSNHSAPARQASPAGAINTLTGVPKTGDELTDWLTLESDRLFVPLGEMVAKWCRSRGYSGSLANLRGEQVLDAYEHALELISKREESEPEPPKAYQPPAGPMTIRNDDPLKAEKLQLKLEARRAYEAEKGRPPDERSLQDYINARLREDNQPEMSSLRDYGQGVGHGPTIEWLTGEFQSRNDRRRQAS